eukprot:762763-Hanusia_phi.AAC.2
MESILFRNQTCKQVWSMNITLNMASLTSLALSGQEPLKNCRIMKMLIFHGFSPGRVMLHAKN